MTKNFLLWFYPSNPQTHLLPPPPKKKHKTKAKVPNSKPASAIMAKVTTKLSFYTRISMANVCVRIHNKFFFSTLFDPQKFLWCHCPDRAFPQTLRNFHLPQSLIAQRRFLTSTSLLHFAYLQLNLFLLLLKFHGKFGVFFLCSFFKILESSYL